MNNNDERDYAEEEYNLRLLHETDSLYESVILLQGIEYLEFEEALLETYMGDFIHKMENTFKLPNPEKGLEYLKQWYYGDPSDDRTSAPMLCGCASQTRYGTDEWLMAWCGRHSMAALWLKIDE